MKIYSGLINVIALLFLIVNINAQVVTNTAVLYSTVTQADNSVVPSVPIPVTIVRTNGKIAELSLNISNVSQNAKIVNLRVYELIYTTNVVETPLQETNSVVVTPPVTNTPPVVVNPPVVVPPVTNTPPVVVNPPVTNTPPVVVTPPITNPPVVVTPPTVITNTPTTITNDVTLSVTIKNANNSEQNVNLPAKTIWTDNKLQNILFDISSLPPTAIVLRFRILDYIYDENGNIIGPQQSGTNSNGTGTGGSGTGTGTGTGSGGYL